MRRVLLSLALSGAAHTLCAPELPAQSRTPIWGLTTLARGQTVKGELTAKDRSSFRDGKYVKEFFFQARAGQMPVVYFRGDFSGTWEMSSYVHPRLFSCNGKSPSPSGQYGSCAMKETLQKDTEVYVMLEADRPGTFTIAVFGNQAEASRNESIFTSHARSPVLSRSRSSTSGVQLSAGYGTVTFQGSQGSGDGEGWTERGAGPSGRVGLGFGAFALFAEGQMSQMAPVGKENDGTDEYTLYHADLGSRLYVLGSGSWLRPYVQFAYGIRRVAGSAEGTDLEMEGVTLTPGAGAQLFLTPGLSIEGSYRRTTGDFTRIRRVGDEWIDIPTESVIRGPTNRISAQMVVHF